MSDDQTVLVVSSDDLFRESAARYLQRSGWKATTAGDVLQALAALTRSATGAVLVLGSFEQRDLRAFVLQVRRRFPHMSVTVVGDSDVDGAHVLPRTTPAPEVIRALRSAPGATTGAATARHGVERDGMALLTTLTARERRILSFLTRGVTKTEIARRMHLSEHTVRTHQQNLYRKLGVHSKLELLRFASQHGLLADETGERPNEPILGP